MIVIFIWFLGIYFMLFIILTYISLILFKRIPKKYGLNYSRAYDVAIIFLPTREIIEKTIEDNTGKIGEKALKRLLRYYNFLMVFRNIFFGLLLILVIWVLLIIMVYNH